MRLLFLRAGQQRLPQVEHPQPRTALERLEAARERVAGQEEAGKLLVRVRVRVSVLELGLGLGLGLGVGVGLVGSRTPTAPG